MSRWFSYVRSQDNATAAITIDIGIEAERDIPSRPLAMLLVRRIEDGAEPGPIRDLEGRLHTKIDEAGLMLVAALTMSGSRTLVIYGADDAPLREIIAGIDEPFAVQTSEDRTWMLYRTLMPTPEEITANLQPHQPGDD